jgi:hypothetical protein
MKKDEALNVLKTFLTDEQLERLRRVSDMRGASISTLIRVAVADYLKSLPKSLSQGRNPSEH